MSQRSRLASLAQPNPGTPTYMRPKQDTSFGLLCPASDVFALGVIVFEMIRGDEVLLRSLKDEGVMIEPDFETVPMRRGPKPLLKKFESYDQEILYIRDEINRLLQSGYKSKQIVVLHRKKRGIGKLQKELRGLDVNIDTMHAYKGLEFEVVFLNQIHETFQQEGENDLSEERRLLYMAMILARQNLNLAT